MITLLTMCLSVYPSTLPLEAYEITLLSVRLVYLYSPLLFVFDAVRFVSKENRRLLLLHYQYRSITAEVSHIKQ
jgi:hypothetical protein